MRDRVRARLPPLTYIDCADVGFQSLHVASLCNCCCRPAAVLFLRVGNRLAHTCVACYYIILPALRSPVPVWRVQHYRCYFSRQSSLVGLLRSNVTASCVVREQFFIIILTFFDLSNPGVLSIFRSFSYRWYCSKVQVQLTITVQDDIDNIFRLYITHLRPNIDFQLAGNPT